MVSIHAPTKGATTLPLPYAGRIRVSIHAPTKGATWCKEVRKMTFGVSIHAPTKGATAILHKSSSDLVLFLSNYTSSCFTLQAG